MKLLTVVVVCLFLLLGSKCDASLSEIETRQQLFSDLKDFFMKEMEKRKQECDYQTSALKEEFYITKSQLKQEILDLKEYFTNERQETKLSILNLQEEMNTKETLYMQEILELKRALDDARKDNGHNIQEVKEQNMSTKLRFQLEIKKLQETCQAAYTYYSSRHKQEDKDKQFLRFLNKTSGPTDEKQYNVTERNVSNPDKEVTAATEKKKEGDNHQTRSTSGLRIAFFARLTNNTAIMNANQAIIFDHTVLNIGHAYSAHLGTFTAPRPGIYVFNVNLLPHKTLADARLVKNGQILAKTHGEHWKQSSQTVIVDLQQGDDVAVKTDHYSNVSFYRDFYCTFSGFLLYDYANTDPLVVGK